MKPVRFHPEAEAELISAATFELLRVGSILLDFLFKLLQNCVHTQALTKRYSKTGHLIRSLLSASV
jgi:hypothetical protein